jgi:hypothetical protein
MRGGEGERLAEGEGDCSGATILDGEELAGVIDSGATELDFQIKYHGEDAEEMASPTVHFTRAGKVPRGDHHGRQREELAGVHG